MSNSPFVTIKTAEAADAAIEIDRLVQSITTEMEELDKIIEKIIVKKELQSNWSDELAAGWKTYYKDDIAKVIEGIKSSSGSLKSEADEWNKYNR